MCPVLLLWLLFHVSIERLPSLPTKHNITYFGRGGRTFICFLTHKIRVYQLKLGARWSSLFIYVQSYAGGWLQLSFYILEGLLSRSPYFIRVTSALATPCQCLIYLLHECTNASRTSLNVCNRLRAVFCTINSLQLYWELSPFFTRGGYSFS